MCVTNTHHITQQKKMLLRTFSSLPCVLHTAVVGGSVCVTEVLVCCLHPTMVATAVSKSTKSLSCHECKTESKKQLPTRRTSIIKPVHIIATYLFASASSTFYSCSSAVAPQQNSYYTCQKHQQMTLAQESATATQEPMNMLKQTDC